MTCACYLKDLRRGISICSPTLLTKQDNVNILKPMFALPGTHLSPSLSGRTIILNCILNIPCFSS